MPAFSPAEMLSRWFGMLPGDPVANLLLSVVILLGVLLTVFAIRLPGGGHFFLLVLFFLLCQVLMTAVDNVLVFLLAWVIAAFLGWAIGQIEAGDPEEGTVDWPLRLSGIVGAALMVIGVMALAKDGNLSMSRLRPGDSGWISFALLAAVLLETVPLIGYTWRNREPRLGWASSAFLVTGVAFMISVYPFARLLLGIYGDLSYGAWREAMLWVGLGGAVLCALAALGETDVKRVVSYGAFSQLLLLFAGLALPSARGLMGTWLVLLVYTFAVATLYLSLGLVEAATGSRRLADLGGVGATHPNLGLASLLGALALAGLPPLGAFLGQTLLFSTFARLPSPWPAALYALALLLTVLYLLRLFRAVFLGRPAHEAVPVRSRLAIIGLLGVTAMLLAFASLPFWAEGVLTPVVGYLMRF